MELENFNVGDIVQVTDDANLSVLKKGELFKVRGIFTDKYLVLESFDGKKDNRLTTFHFDESMFLKVYNSKVAKLLFSI